MKSVFISSTSRDLTEHRAAVDKAIRRLELRPINMDDFGSQPGGASGVSLREVGKADIFVGIIANRYGYIPEGMEKSVTEQEYDEAVKRGLPRLMYLLDPETDWPTEEPYIDEEPEKAAKLAAFKQRINSTEVRSLFTTPDNLAAQISSDLTKLLDKQQRQRVGSILAAAVVVILLIIGFISVLDPRIPSPLDLIPTPLEGVPADEGEVLVVVAQFSGANTAAADQQINILEVLQEAAEVVGEITVIPIGHTTEDTEEAQKIGQLYNATMVIYGRVAPGGVTARYLVLDEKIRYRIERDVRISADDVENYEVFLYEGIDVNYILHFSIGQLYYFDNQCQSAINIFDSAEESLDSDSSHRQELDAHILFIYRGLCHHTQGEYASAVIDYTKAAEIEPDFEDIYINRGNSYLELGQYDLALTDYNHAHELAPDFIDVYLNRGNVYLDMGDFESALADFDYAIELNENIADGYRGRGQAYYGLGSSYYAEAILDFRHYMGLTATYVSWMEGLIQEMLVELAKPD